MTEEDKPICYFEINNTAKHLPELVVTHDGKDLNVIQIGEGAEVRFNGGLETAESARKIADALAAIMGTKEKP